MEKVTYLLCPRCQRALPTTSGERYCPNDGTRMLAACPACGAAMISPSSRFCARCGVSLLEQPRPH